MDHDWFWPGHARMFFSGVNGDDHFASLAAYIFHRVLLTYRVIIRNIIPSEQQNTFCDQRRHSPIQLYSDFPSI